MVICQIPYVVQKKYNILSMETSIPQHTCGMPAQLNLHLTFNRGKAYSSGVSEKQKRKTKNSAISACPVGPEDRTGAALR